MKLRTLIDLKKRTIVEVLVLIILIFLIPTILIFSYFFKVSLESNTRIVNSNMENHLEWAAGDLKDQLTIFSHYAVQLSDNKTLTRLFLQEESGYYDLLICEELQKMFYSNTLTDQIYLYSQNRGKLYSGSVMYSEGNFNTYKNQVYFEDWSYDDMINHLNNLNQFDVHLHDSFTVFSETDKRDVVVLMYPVNKISDQMVLFIVVDLNRLNNLLQINDEEDGQVFGLYYKDQVVTGKGSSTLLNALNAGEVSSETNLTHLDNINYLVEKDTVGTTDFKIILAIPQELANIEINQIQKDTYWLLFISTCLIAVALFLMFYTIYVPVRKLASRAGKSSKAKSKNEFTIIMDRLNELSEVLNGQPDTSLQYSSLDENIICILNGDIQDVNELDDNPSTKGLFTSSYNILLTSKFIETIDKDTLSRIDTFIDKENRLVSGGGVYKYISFVDGKIITILTVDESDIIDAIIKEITKSYQFIFQKKLVTGVSCIKANIEDFHSAYVESLLALDCAIIKELEYLSYEHLNDFDSLEIPANYMSAFEYALLYENPDELEKSTIAIIDFLKEPKLSTHSIKYIYLYVFEKLTKLSLKKGLHDEIEDFQNIAFIKAVNISNMTEILVAVLQVLLEKIRSEISIDQLPDKISLLQFIDANYNEPWFSIARAADHYGMPVSTYSNYFKQMIHIGFKEYVDMKKMENAKLLLIETDYSLEKISLEMNYSNASNFSRAFKAIVGITPGKYRNQHKN